MSKKLFFNSLSGTVLYAVNIVVAFIMSPVLIMALGNRDFGLWELVMSVIGYMGMLDLGVGGSLVRFVSVADGRQDKNDLQQTVSTAFVFFSVVGVVAVCLFLVLGYSPGIIIGHETNGIANLSTVFFLLGINSGMLFPMQVYIATLMGLQRHYYINNVRIILTTSRASLTYYLLLRFEGSGLIILALLEPFFTVIQFMLFAGAVHLNPNLPKITISSVSRNKAREMICFGAKSATMLVASRLRDFSVPFIIGNALGLGLIVFYIIPNRLITYAKNMSEAIGFPLTPYFGSTHGKGDHAGLIKSWIATSLALQVISLAMPVVIFFCGEAFIGLWMGREYAVETRIVLNIMLVGLVIDALSANAFRVLVAQGKHGKCALMLLFFSVLSILGGFLGAYMFGVVGVATATTIISIIANFYTLRITCKVMKVTLKQYFSSTVYILLLPLSLFAGTMWLFSYLFPPVSYLKLSLTFIVCSSFYIFGLWKFTLSCDMRETTRTKLRHLLSS